MSAKLEVSVHASQEHRTHVVQRGGTATWKAGPVWNQPNPAPYGWSRLLLTPRSRDVARLPVAVLPLARSTSLSACRCSCTYVCALFVRLARADWLPFYLCVLGLAGTRSGQADTQALVTVLWEGKGQVQTNGW